MDPPSSPSQDVVSPRIRPFDDRLLGGIGRLFGLATLAGLGLFGAYITLRASGATTKNFEQWQALVAGLPMPTASAWIANLGIGLHFVMGTVLVLAWPILLSARSAHGTAACIGGRAASTSLRASWPVRAGCRSSSPMAPPAGPPPLRSVFGVP